MPGRSPDIRASRSGAGAYYPGGRLSLASDTAIRRRVSGWSSAGSFLLLLAAVCAVPMAPGVTAAGQNGPALKTAKIQPTAIRAKLLGRLSMARRQALGAGARQVFASVLGMPASLAYTATCEAGSGRAAQPTSEAVPRAGHAPPLDARPPPRSVPLV
jgi:hypothetical protein